MNLGRTAEQRVTMPSTHTRRDRNVADSVRGESVDAWQWSRVPGTPDSACVY